MHPSFTDQQLRQLQTKLAHCLDGALSPAAPEQLSALATQVDLLLGCLLSMDADTLARLMGHLSAPPCSCAEQEV